jgi:hypothetical protein
MGGRGDFTAFMRALLTVILFCTLVIAGCARKPAPAPQPAGAPRTGAAPAPAKAGTTNQALTVTPEVALVGRVAMVNASGRFVVLTFPVGRMVPVEQRLNLYRHGQKVGEVKITGPRREDNIVADLGAGEADVGDEARNQ